MSNLLCLNFIEFAAQAKRKAKKPITVTGGFKTQAQIESALFAGCADAVGLARALVLNPELPGQWISNVGGNPEFRRFESPPEGGITAWYTMRMSEIAQRRETVEKPNLESAVLEYERRDRERELIWKARFV